MGAMAAVPAAISAGTALYDTIKGNKGASISSPFPFAPGYAKTWLDIANINQQPAFDFANQALGAGGNALGSLGNYANAFAPAAFAGMGMGMGGLAQGLQGGFLPQNMNYMEANLRPALERSYGLGAADIREQAGLVGNARSSGALQQLTDYRAQLENALGGQLAGAYAGALPTAISTQGNLTNTALGLGPQYASAFLNPLISAGLQSMTMPMQAAGVASGLMGGAPYMAQQQQGLSPLFGMLPQMFGSGGGATGGKKSGGGGTAGQTTPGFSSTGMGVY